MFSSVKLRNLLWLIVHIDADTHLKKNLLRKSHIQGTWQKGLKLYVWINGVEWVEYCF